MTYDLNLIYGLNLQAYILLRSAICQNRSDARSKRKTLTLYYDSIKSLKCQQKAPKQSGYNLRFLMSQSKSLYLAIALWQRRLYVAIYIYTVYSLYMMIKMLKFILLFCPIRACFSVRYIFQQSFRAFALECPLFLRLPLLRNPPRKDECILCICRSLYICRIL